MPKIGFSSYERQAYLNSKVEILRSLYVEAQEKIRKKLARIDLAAKERYRSQMILSEVRGIIRGLNSDTKKWVLKNIPRGYERGFDIAAERLKILGVTRRVDFDAQIHTSSINILAVLYWPVLRLNRFVKTVALSTKPTAIFVAMSCL